MMSGEDPEILDRYEQACEMLAQGVTRAKHPYHLMTVASLNGQGAPELRTVVCRGFDAENRQLLFHTDIRSPKAHWLKQYPQTSVLFYDDETKIQLRFYATATLHHQDEWASRQWSKTKDHSKSCYLTPYAAGEQVSNSGECGVDGHSVKVTSQQEDELAFSHFAVIACRYHALDMLQLKATGHVRALLKWDVDNRCKAMWIAA